MTTEGTPTNQTIEAPVHAVVMTRIAVALERIADALEDRKRPTMTPFPWNEIKQTHRRRIQDHFVAHKGMECPSVFDQMDWPLTCEQICEVGELELREGRYVGDKVIAEIREVLDRLGFRF